MGGRSNDSGSQVIVRLPPEIIRELDEYVELYSKDSILNVKIGRATVAREAILHGLPILKKKFEEIRGSSDVKDDD